MVDPLSALVSEGLVEVVSRLKSGKEADLYLVRHAGEVVAAKIYKERQARSFHNNAAYKEGRVAGNSRTQRAMDKGTRFGRAAAEEAWKEKEAETLFKLHAAGMRVPRPVLFVEGVLLMELVIDAAGYPAPRLIDTVVPREHAAAHYADVRAQMVKMLTADLIHGDLSPYNVLLAWNGPTIIDFPQVVGAAHNQQAARFFLRDFEAIWRFFAAIDPALNARRADGEEIWRAYERRELTADFEPTGRGVPRSAAPGPSRPGPHQGGQPPRHFDARRGERRSSPQPSVSYVGQPAPAAPPAATDHPAAVAHPGRRHRRRGRRRSSP